MTVKQYLAKIGSKGGKAAAANMTDVQRKARARKATANLTPAQKSARAKKAAAARWRGSKRKGVL